MSINNQKVSVIIPAYNAEHTLGTCIESVLMQELKPSEVIVINDGSTDQTVYVARAYEDRIIYVEQDNQGQGAARNRGLHLASGDFIAFLDADDYWLNNFLKSCVIFLLENIDAIAVSTGLIVKMANGKHRILPPCVLSGKSSKHPIMIENFFQFWAEQDHVRTGSNVIRKDVIDKAGLQLEDLRVSQDLEYWGYIATFGKWGFIPEPMWVGNSQAASVAVGWSRKYKQRRRLCPTVEAWERRIVPRLKYDEISAFNVVRGRVALNFAQNKILYGDYKQSFTIMKKYGDSMPRNSLAVLMTTGTDFGALGWFFVCLVVRFKEFVKVWRLNTNERKKRL